LQHDNTKSYPGREQLGQVFNLCTEIGKAVTLQRVFNPELFPKNGSLRGLKRLTKETRTQMLADKMIRCWQGPPNAHEVDMLLKAGVDVEYIHPQAEGATFLGLAARHGYPHCVDALLRQGADSAAKAANKLTPFQQAAYMGQADVMDLMLAKGADLSQRTDYGMTPLMLVVNGLGRRENCCRALEVLLARGVSLDDKDNDGRTVMDIYTRNRFGYASLGWKQDWAKPLLDAVEERAARRRKKEATQKLLRAVRNTGSPGGKPPDPKALQRYIDDGADIEVIEDDLWKTTPLAILCNYNCLEQVKVLIAAGANVSPRHPERGTTPLIAAAFFGYTDTLGLLLDHGAEVDEADNDGKTALINTVSWGCRREAAQLLAARGASIRATDGSGKTVFDYCKEGALSDKNYSGRSGREVFGEVERDLLFAECLQLWESGRDLLEMGSGWGIAVLCAAAATGDKKIAAALIGAGVDVGAKDARGQTPLHCAAAAGQTEMAGYLIEKGAGVDAPDAEGRTPLMLAVYPRCFASLAHLLLDHGARADIGFRRSVINAEDIRLGSVVEEGKEPKEAQAAQRELATRICATAVKQAAQQFIEGTREGVTLNRKFRLKPASQC